MNPYELTAGELKQIKLMEALQDADKATDARGLRVQLLREDSESSFREILWSHCQQWYPGSLHLGPHPQAEINALTNLILVANVLRTHLDANTDTRLM